MEVIQSNENPLRVYEHDCLERKNEFAKPFAVYFFDSLLTKQKHIISKSDQPKVIEVHAFENFADEQFVYWKAEFKNSSEFPRELLCESFTFGNIMRVSWYDLSLERNSDTRNFNFTKEKRARLENSFSRTLFKCEVYYSHQELDDKLESVFEVMKANSEKHKKIEKPLGDRKF